MYLKGGDAAQLAAQVIRRGGSSEVDARLGGLAKHRADARMGVLDERTRIAVEVDRLAGIEQHRFLGIDL